MNHTAQLEAEVNKIVAPVFENRKINRATPVAELRKRLTEQGNMVIKSASGDKTFVITENGIYIKEDPIDPMGIDNDYEE